MLDIEHQIRTFCENLDETVPEVGLDEITAPRVRRLDDRDSQRPWPGWLIAATAATSVLLVVGALTWVITRGSDSDVVDQPSTTTLTAARAVEVTRDIVYAVFKPLDVYAPTEPGPWPVAIAVHGFGEGRTAMAALSEAIASQGMVVFNISVTMDAPFLTAIEQVACAVRFSRATAADYGGDPTRITVVGSSAGAATGAVVALAGDDYVEDCDVTDGSALPDALVGYEGPYDYATNDYDVVNLVPLREDDPKLWEAINPYSHIGGNPDLRVRLIHGVDIDDLWYEVPPEVSVEFHQALIEAGYDVELTVVDGATHVDLPRSTSEAFEVTVQQVLQAARG